MDGNSPLAKPILCKALAGGLERRGLGMYRSVGWERLEKYCAHNKRGLRILVFLYARV